MYSKTKLSSLYIRATIEKDQLFCKHEEQCVCCITTQGREARLVCRTKTKLIVRQDQERRNAKTSQHSAL